MEWKDIIEKEQIKPYFLNLKKKLEIIYKEKTIYPEKSLIFNAFKQTPFENVKIVIIGQDPYQTPGYANGLAFSVNPKVTIPKSLHNMFIELKNDLGFSYPTNGDLTPWAQKGVLLLNRILTVEKGNSMSHQNLGWEEFTLEIIKILNDCPRKMVFILLGNQAQTLAQYLNNKNHLVIKAPHPSPLSAYRGFFGSRIYSKSCLFLGISEDIWRLT